jgi:hypothetical protein
MQPRSSHGGKNQCSTATVSLTIQRRPPQPKSLADAGHRDRNPRQCLALRRFEATEDADFLLFRRGYRAFLRALQLAVDDLGRAFGGILTGLSQRVGGSLVSVGVT